MIRNVSDCKNDNDVERNVGPTDGTIDGNNVETDVGKTDGSDDGSDDGNDVVWDVGNEDGITDGENDGRIDGSKEDDVKKGGSNEDEGTDVGVYVQSRQEVFVHLLSVNILVL